MFQEKFLHFLWQFGRFDATQLKTTAGEPITILKKGIYNTDAGPDFINARLRIGEMVWAGCVEMHIKSSDWLAHGHQHDAAYHNVILHVVWEEDVKIPIKNQAVNTLSLKGRVKENLLAKYQQLWYEKDAIACKSLLGNVASEVRRVWLERMLVERMEQKTNHVAQLLSLSKNDWEEVFWQMVARGFAGKINAEAMEQLAREVPLKYLLRRKHEPFAIEAMLWGCSGMLNSEVENYDLYLKSFDYLKKMYKLRVMRSHQWKQFRMRPSSLPTHRISQLAGWVRQTAMPFHQLLNAQSLADLGRIFQLEEEEEEFLGPICDVNSLGKTAVNHLLINSVVPFLFHYGKQNSIEKHNQNALRWLGEMEAEENAIIRMWNIAGISSQSASDSQSLLQLYKHYCQPKRCLECAIGCAVIK